MLLSTPTRLLWLNAGDASPAALIDDVRVEALAANDETTVACLAGGERAALHHRRPRDDYALCQ